MCLYTEKNAKGLICITLYVDDYLKVNNFEALDKAITIYKTWASNKYHRRAAESFIVQVKSS